MWDIYDHVNQGGENAIAQWTRGLESVQRKKLRAKIDMLAQAGAEPMNEDDAAEIVDDVRAAKIGKGDKGTSYSN